MKARIRCTLFLPRSFYSLPKDLQPKLLFHKVYFRKDTNTLQKIFKFHWRNQPSRPQNTQPWKSYENMHWPGRNCHLPSYYLHSGQHLYKPQMFCTQDRLEPDCKHLLFFQSTDPLAPWLHVFATPTAFQLRLEQWWVCKSAIHHLEPHLLPSCTRPGKAPKNMTNIWHVEMDQHIKLATLNLKMLEKSIIA